MRSVAAGLDADMNSRQVGRIASLHNFALKRPARPVTPLAPVVGGPGTDPGYARVAPGLAAA